MKDEKEEQKRLDKKAYNKAYYHLNKNKAQEVAKTYYQENKDKLKQYAKNYAQDHKEEIKIKKDIYNENNKDNIKAYRDEYHLINKEKRNEESRNYSKKNRDRRRVLENNFQKQKKKDDPIFKLKSSIRSSISSALANKSRAKNFVKNKTMEILGCDFNTLLEHLINTAIINYGSYNQNIKYHIDHVIPLSTATTAEGVIKLNFYTNLQYLYPEDNLKKGDKLDWKLDYHQDIYE